MKNYGKLYAYPEIIEDEDGVEYPVIIFRDQNGQDWHDLTNQSPHPFYIAVDDFGTIVSMETDPYSSQISGYDLIGIDESFGYTYGADGNVYGKKWNGTEIIFPKGKDLFERLTKKEFRDNLITNGIMPSDITNKIMEIDSIVERESVMNAWENSDYYDRYDALINQLGLLLELTAETIDDMWPKKN